MGECGRRFTIVLVGLLLVCASAAHTLGDGYYKSTAAFPAPPTIPIQRAMIVYRDGVETLIVESTYKTDSPDVGWILPLPAEPSRIEMADAAMLQSVSKCIQPAVVADSALVLLLCTAVFVFTLIVAMSIIIPRRPTKWLGGIVLLLLAAITCLMMPTLGTKPLATPDLKVGSPQRVGNYEVQVVHTNSVDALADWIGGAKLQPLSAVEKSVFADYAARNWCFLVARLHRDAGGEATPHPIAATFPAARPVFPMKATGLAGTTTVVELIIVSDQQAGAESFDCIAADRFNVLASHEQGKSTATQSVQMGPWAQSEETKLTFGHPDAVGRLWNGCVVTKLSAELEPAEMARDVEIALRPLDHPVRATRYSAQARWQGSLSVLSFGGIIVLLGAMTVWQHRRRSRGWERWAVAAAAFLAIGSSVYFYATARVIPVRTESRVDQVLRRRLNRIQMETAQKAIEAGRIRTSTPIEAIGAVLGSEGQDDELRVNVYTHAPLSAARSAGNCIVRVIEGKPFLCFYDESCTEFRLALPAEHASTRPATMP